MFSWPSLPSVSLPAAIQRHFLSFCLKKSLGHLVKPGQLDPAQIDSQIGSGFVQVNNVELDHDAINKHLTDLPVPLRLEAGTIGKISAQIPWPNLLTAPFALSLSSLSLTFVFVPRASRTTDLAPTRDELAESVASLAESFINNELSEKENQTLRESLHAESYPIHPHPPGYIDPFISAEELDVESQSDASGEDVEQEGDADPSTQGISLIAILVERLLARFEFDASDVALRIILPGKAEFVLRLGQVVYSTEIASDPRPEEGEIRTIKAADISLSTRDLTPLPPPSNTSRRRSASPYASSPSSDGDEEAMMMMSQSIASLPPHSSVRSLSPGSSMYHSAASSLRSSSPESFPDVDIEERKGNEEKILSSGLGSDPVVLRLVTPPLVVPSLPAEPSQRGIGIKHRFQSGSANKIRLTITVGPMAVALLPVHVRSLQHLTTALAASRPADLIPKPPQNPLEDPLDFKLHIRSITLLLIKPPTTLFCSQSDQLQHFFLARPSSPPPRIPHLRLQLDTFDLSHSSLPAIPSQRTSGSPGFGSKPRNQLLKASLADISIFAFFATGEEWNASPVLVSDPNLNAQYERDAQFPAFDVVDWTKPGSVGTSVKASQWRVRPSNIRRKSSGAVPSGSPTPSHVPVLQARLGSGVCEVNLVPLHLFVDIGIAERAISFLDAATATDGFHGDDDGNVDMESTPPATPRAKEHRLGEQERERKRLEDLVMEDFTEHDAGTTASSAIGTKYVICVPLLRIQVRVPPPPSWGAGPRSGAFVLDMHGVRITQQDGPAPSRHMTHLESDGSTAGPKILAMVEFRRLIAAATLPGESKASTLLSVAAQTMPETPSLAFGAGLPPYMHSSPGKPLPSICLRSNPILPHRPSTTTSPGVASSFSLDAHLPAVHGLLSKPSLDALTFWADDISQVLLGDSEHTATSDASGRSRDPSLIGSRFFARKAASMGSSETGGEDRKSELVVKVSVAEAQIRLLVPRKGDSGKSRPFDVTASDVDFLAEIKPEGKDETVVTVGVMSLNISNTSAQGDAVAILGLTIPRHLNTSPKSLLKLRFISAVDSDTAAKESRLKVTASGFTYDFTPEFDWIADVGSFAKTPEGAFESVVPSERTRVAIKVTDGSVRFIAPKHTGALVAYIGELDFSTDLVGSSPETMVNTVVPSSSFFFIDDAGQPPTVKASHVVAQTGAGLWKQTGYALLADIGNVALRLRHQTAPSINTQVHVDSVKVQVHACADTLLALGSFASDLGSTFQDIKAKPSRPSRPTAIPHSIHPQQKRDVLASVDEHAFRRVPDLGPAPDMIHDDLPTNPEYLDASFGAAAGLRELRDDDLFDFEPDDADSGRNTPTSTPATEGVISSFGGETIRMLDSRGIRVVEGHFENIPYEAVDLSFGAGDAKLNIRVRNCDLTISLYDGYDWLRTRKFIEDEVKAIRRRLVKIRQLLASGQTPDDSIEETNAILFNSVYIGLPQASEELEPSALIAAIDKELDDDGDGDGGTDTASQSSWQSFKRRPQHDSPIASRVRGKKLARSKGSQIDFCLTGIQAEVDQFHPNGPLVSRILTTVRDLEILDHIKTSTWKKFLTELRTDFRGNVRETASDMVRAELRIVHPVPNLPTEEGRLRAKVLPIKLHVDQDALDFMKKFFSFQNADAPVSSETLENELYFQHVEVFPVDLKLDYKPKRVDYKALREGKTIELMNFFHFDGAEITLRHITLSGITGWPRLFETLNDLWTPDVKANQLTDIISGVSPVRSLVNVGSGVADLVLLPIAQYKKDRRVIRGVQKGTTSFVKTTAMEAIKLGARLATGTQVILEQAETVLGGQGQFKATVTAETLQSPVSAGSSDEDDVVDLISKYADQPIDVREGMQTAYKSLRKNFNSAAQTILAVPMEVYERSGNEGPVRAVIRAVPIAVLKPMIGASEAVSKTLFGLRNTMDPEVKHENEAKYKQR